MSYQQVVYEIVNRILNGESLSSIISYLNGITYTESKQHLAKETKLSIIDDSKTLLKRLSESKNINEEFSEFRKFDLILKLSSNQEHLDLLDSAYSTIENDSNDS